MSKGTIENDIVTVLQLVLMDETGDSYYRMRWPGEVLARQAAHWRVINLDARAEERLTWAKEADVLVLFQSNDLDLVPIIRERREMGKKTIVEYNDNFYAPTPSSPVREAWSSPLLWQIYEILMREADHIIVTGEGLKRLFSTRVQKDISILENHILDLPHNFLELEQNRVNSSEEFRIGWAGSVGHMPDLIAVLPTLRDFCLQHPTAKLYLMGNESIPEIVNLPKDKFVFRPWGSMAEYHEFLSQIHIGLAPLSHSDYNICRSDVKALEYASRGAIPIVQQILPYEKVIESGLAYSFSDFKQLTGLLEKFLLDPKDRIESAKKSFELVSANRSALNRIERLELYKKHVPESGYTGFDFGLSAGYHEVMGTTNATLKTQVISQNAEKFLQQGHLNQCLELVQANEKQLSFDPHLTLTYVRALMKGNVPPDKTVPLILSAIKRFPLDLRFRLILLNEKKEPHEKAGIWENIIEVLDTAGNLFRQFFKGQVLSFFIRELDRNPGMLGIGERFTEIYPNHAGLLFKVAEVARNSGADDLNKRLISKINTIKAIITDSAEFMATVPKDYIDTLQEAADYKSRM